MKEDGLKKFVAPTDQKLFPFSYRAASRFQNLKSYSNFHSCPGILQEAVNWHFLSNKSTNLSIKIIVANREMV